MKILKRLGKWVILYLAFKWTVLVALIYWLSRYEWFRFEYLLALPAIVLTGALFKFLLKKRKQTNHVATD